PPRALRRNRTRTAASTARYVVGARLVARADDSSRLLRTRRAGPLLGAMATRRQEAARARHGEECRILLGGHAGRDARAPGSRRAQRSSRTSSSRARGLS